MRLTDDTESLAHVTSVIVDVARGGEGLRLNELRSGPLNKKGVGSGIIDALGHINTEESARLQEFASSKISTDLDSLGESELGLNLQEITALMDANFKRAAGRRWSLPELRGGEHLVHRTPTASADAPR